MNHRRVLLYALILAICVNAASAANVSLTTDRNETVLNENLSSVGIKLGETIRFYIKATDVGRSSGGFTLSKEISENRYEMIGQPHFTSSCTMCKGTREMGDLDEVYLFTPSEAGSYRAEAAYSTSVKCVALEVWGPSTSTSTTTSSSSTSTSTSTSTTTSTTTTTTTTTTTSTSTTSTTSTTLPEGLSLSGDGTWPVILLALFILALSLILFGKYRTQKN